MKRLSILIFSFFSILIFTSCEGFFSQESDHVIYADEPHLNNAVDTMYSVLGILDKLQVLADRTVLLGEVRGDLVTTTSYVPDDVYEIANFNVSDDNIYNSPRDYYAVINNCNYFIQNVSKSLKNNRNEYVFMNEYAVVKSIRAWTYLQLALNYGQVRYVTKPILTKQDADSENSYPLLGIEALCEALIKDLTPLVPQYATEYPQYSTIGGSDTRLSYFPLYIMLGELNLWAGNYKEAALCYYNYINTRNGMNSFYPTGTDYVGWGRLLSTVPTTWRYRSTGEMAVSETYTTNAELITQIPISAEYDSVANPRFNQLRVLFNSRADNDYHVSLVPSQAIQDLSEEQWYCMVVSTDNGTTFDTIYAPRSLDENMTGDLRLYDSWYRYDNFRGKNNELIQYQQITKFNSRNVHIWRRQMVYLRMAEALNRAGYPRFAFKILQEGINDENIASDVLPYYTTLADSAYIQQFSFPESRYKLYGKLKEGENQQGIHTRGSGNTPANAYYQMPEFDTPDSLSLQIDSVERMIVNEGALELAFEGHRFYDLMRVALRRNDPSFLADKVYGRRGQDERATVQSEIKKNLLNKNNWYLNWNGKIGLGSR